ncbi:sensor histidine kinase [Pseudochryseolinea flava]|uniref:histidine kinase n=1 Tax=Pseudochryseolinea flava TaxID=2059302 RepID=A0A364Y0E2_9BACT|nr:histidine kinase [Pseudochryseolinea flava]RAW00068.1 histidine kinase [Pseudochryseolinea flava]
MILKFNTEDKLKFNRFSKLGMWYILALSVIAIVSIVGQFLIQNHLKSQSSDSRVVNLAGTQRYKSQWIVKMSLLLYTDIEHTHFADKAATLEKLLEEWKRGHVGLQHGDTALQLPGTNSDSIIRMFQDIDPYFQHVYESAKAIIAFKKGEVRDKASIDNAVKLLLDNEFAFLQKMDRIVFQYDFEAKQKIATLSKLEYFLLALSILVIALEILFVFRPTAVQVNKTVNQLIASEKNAKKLSKEIGVLYASLEKSYEDLSHVNLPKETPKLYAKTDRGGNVTFISDLFADLSGIDEGATGGVVKDLFGDESLDEDSLEEILDLVSNGKAWQGVVRYVNEKTGKDRWAEIMIVPVVNEEDEIDEWLIMGSDITRQKFAEQNMREKNRAEVEKKVNQQKFRSVLILEGQEEERKRLAMDIHDGIGQMLTSLKFHIESINATGDPTAVQQKLTEIQHLIAQVIKEVRRVTFNLKPTVLGDYGLQAALNVFVKEIGKLTEIKLAYQTEGDTSVRLPQKIENNIFRIIQEAINNAIKYSSATQIDVILQQEEETVNIIVQDNGNGFDEKLVEARSVNIESGRGFFNMYERTEYINGALSIKSEPGKGTRVHLAVPVKTLIAV